MFHLLNFSISSFTLISTHSKLVSTHSVCVFDRSLEVSDHSTCVSNHSLEVSIHSPTMNTNPLRKTDYFHIQLTSTMFQLLNFSISSFTLISTHSELVSSHSVCVFDHSLEVSDHSTCVSNHSLEVSIHSPGDEHQSSRKRHTSIYMLTTGKTPATYQMVVGFLRNNQLAILV